MPTPRIDVQELPQILELTAQLSPQEFIVLDQAGKVQYATARANTLLGRVEKDLTGMSVTDVLGESLSLKLLDGGVEKQDWLVVEHKIPQLDGDSLNAQISYLTLQDRETLTGCFLIAITPLDTPVDKKLTSMGEITASIAHEIRNPLAGILTTTETLKEDFDPQDERREYLERIITEINRVNLFLVKFLALARPQKPQFNLSSLPDILDHVLLLESKTIERCDVHVVRDYDNDYPPIVIDQHQIQQVLLNLILNAIQAMPDGGKLTIAIRSVNNFTQLEVSDSGTGIARQDLKKIFLPFFSTKPKGVGLGLSVSQQILQEHGGKLTVNTVSGKGTTFTLTLPDSQDN